MTTNLQIGDTFPDFELPDYRRKQRRHSRFTAPSLLDEKLGFTEGYPLIVVFGRGFFCPRDQQQMRQLVHFQSEVPHREARGVGELRGSRERSRPDGSQCPEGRGVIG
jgi:peroxiredoxin